jgi:hypothetical protein
MDTDSLVPDPAATARPPIYRSYLLRFWEERGDQAAPVWRFSLEDPQTARRQGFASLAALTHWLQSEIEGPHSPPPSTTEAR